MKEEHGNPIDRMFPTVGRDRFISEFYARKPCIEHGPLERLLFGNDSSLFSAGPLFEKAARETLNAYMKRDGKPYHFRIQPESAKSFYDSGGTVEVGNPFQAFPVLETFGQALRDEVGASHLNAVMLASPGGDALPMHFDQQDVFIFHLAGRKRWLIAENQSVSDPVDSYFPRTAGVGRDDAPWPAYFPWKMPTQMPENVIDVVLEAGSVAYVPRGWWHQTIAPEPSVSLTIMCTAPHFARQFVTYLQKLLVNNPRMRRAVITPRGAESFVAGGESIAALLDGVREIIAQLKPGDLQHRSIQERRFQRVDGAQLNVVKKTESQDVAQVSIKGDLVAEIEVDSVLAPLCTWAARQSTFTGASASRATEIYDTDLIEKSLEVLVEAGFLVESTR